MRRPLPLLLVTASLALAACGGDDEAATDTVAPATTFAPSTTEARADGSAAASTVPTGSSDSAAASTVPISIDDCEDAPAPADYIEGQIPPAVRPCESPTELVVHTIRMGTGRAAAAGDTLVADYTGIRSETGILFDTSYTRGVPLDFPIGRGGVIPGWDQGLLGAQAGAMYKLDIPSDLAYGDEPPAGSDIEAGDALTFIVEVRAVVPSVTADQAPLDVDIEPSVGALEVTSTDVAVGDGAPVELGKTAIVHILLVRGDNAIVLFNSWERDDPLQIMMEEGQTLPGIFAGLQGANVGTLRVVTMPPAAAFGPDGESSLGLPAGVDLIAVLEVVGVY
jgi:peptidylprolyl isomerase